jgi:hypothetical protein
MSTTAALVAIGAGIGLTWTHTASAGSPKLYVLREGQPPVCGTLENQAPPDGSTRDMLVISVKGSAEPETIPRDAVRFMANVSSCD